MSQQRMAGSQGFQSGMKKAAGGPQLIGADAWDRQVGRESAQKDNAAVQGSTGASNLADYINVSKSATQGNNSFSIDNANKYVNNSRDQSKIIKQITLASLISVGKRMLTLLISKWITIWSATKASQWVTTTITSWNNAKDHREDNTAKATAFADRTVDKYIQKNKDTQAINVGALDQQVRAAPITIVLMEHSKARIHTVICIHTAVRNYLHGNEVNQ